MIRARVRRGAWQTLGIALLVGTGAAVGRAQSTAGVPSGANGTLASTADSVRLLADLERSVRRARSDGPLWHRKGLLAWGLVYDHQRDSFISRREDIAHLRDADSSLRIATSLSPDSARFWLDLQNFLLHSAAPSARSAAGRVARDAAAAAERSGDRALLAESRDREGMRFWRNYEALSRRQLSDDPRDVAGGTLEPAEFDPSAVESINRMLTGDTRDDFRGEADYRRAEQAFEEAVRAGSALRPARRHVYMLLAERERWDQLRNTAFARTQESSDDGDAWLALGLAAHRLGDEEAAARAFERGLAAVGDAERSRLTSLARILPPHPSLGRIDSATYVTATPKQRAIMERGFWQLADPLALTPINEHRLEFYARVAYSELLWTVEEAGQRGADTERGDVFVRFGPPLVILRTGDAGVANVTEWRYPYKRFYFWTPGGFGTAKLQSESFDLANDYRQALPVRWRDAPAAQPDSVPVQVARFRAGGDSTALYVSAAVPAGRLIGDVGRGAASVDVGFTLFDATVETVLRDSTRVQVAAGDASANGARAWRGTVPPGRYGYRVEALGVASRRGARGIGSVAARADSGFGVSDLLLAASVQPGAGAADRWTGYSIVPNAAAYRRGTPVALLWETYALEADSNRVSRYRVTVSVEPASRGAVVDLVARIVAGAAGAVGLRGRSESDGHLTIAFDRQAPARPITVDYLSLDLGDAPPRRYVVRISVEDTVAHRTTATFASFRVVE